MAKSLGKPGGKSKTLLPDYPVNEFLGLNTYVKDLRQLQDGETPDSLNWITGRYKDHIYLRGGSQLLGNTRINGGGRISGLAIGTTNAGTQVPFFTYGKNLAYYNGSNATSLGSVFPTAAAADDFSVMPYKNIAGCYVYITSPNSSMYKIAVANPASYIDLGPADYKGHAKLGTNRMFLWNRVDTKNQKYTSVIYNSIPDQTVLSAYTQTTGQNVGTGDGSTKTFTGTISITQGTIFNVEFVGPIAAGISVTGITKATQAVVTAPGSNYSVGDVVYLSGIGGMTQINNIPGVVTQAVSGTFTLSINSTGFSSFTSGGSAYKSEYFIDDQNGNMKSNLGGTGSVNYVTGTYTINFVTAPINSGAIYNQFYSEYLTGSVADFVSSGSAAYPQFDGGGDIQNIYSFDQVEYCFHLLSTWYLSVAGTSPFNLPYRNRLGTPFLRAGYATEDGVVYLDGSIPSQPRVQILQIDANSSTAVVTVVPTSISDQLDLTQFGFSQAAVYRWNEFDLLACAPSLNGVVQSNNAALFVRNIFSGLWDYTDLPASCFDEYNGTLIAGDSFSNNLFTLFSYFDDDGAQINNYWTGKMFNLGVEGLKKFNRFVIKGLIQQDQSIDINFSFDSGNFTKFFTVSGMGSYVNIGNPVEIGNSTIGSHVIGGGGDVVTAYPFEVEFVVNADVFEYVQPQFEATGIGYVQIDGFTFKDGRIKSRRVLPGRTANPD